MTRAILVAFLLGSLLGPLFTSGAHAQEQKPAAEAAKPEPVPGQEPDPEIIQGIMTCLAEGLPADWRKAWFTVRQTGRNAAGNAREFQADFYYATSDSDNKGQRLKPCGGGEEVIDGVGKLNAYLTESQRRWSGATFSFFRDGRYNAAYDYTPFKEKPAANSATKPEAKKKKKETAK